MRKFGCVLFLCGAVGYIVCLIAYMVFRFQNIDMTDMRVLVEYPWPIVWCVIDTVFMYLGRYLIMRK